MPDNDSVTPNLGEIEEVKDVAQHYEPEVNQTVEEKGCQEEVQQEEAVTPIDIKKGKSIKAPKKAVRKAQVSPPLKDGMEMLEDAISDHLNPSPVPEEEEKRSRGRPSKAVDMSPEAIASQINLVAGKKLNSQIGTSNRADALLTACMRTIKRIPDVILKYMTSKTHYKSSDMNVYFKCWIQCFLHGFLSVFEVEEKNMENIKKMFFHFIVLAFPKAKVEAVLDALFSKCAISVTKRDQYKRFLATGSKTTKKAYGQLIKSNVCFDLICQSIVPLCDSISANNKETLQDKISALISLRNQ